MHQSQSALTNHIWNFCHIHFLKKVLKFQGVCSNDKKGTKPARCLWFDITTQLDCLKKERECLYLFTLRAGLPCGEGGGWVALSNRRSPGNSCVNWASFRCTPCALTRKFWKTGTFYPLFGVSFTVKRRFRSSERKLWKFSWKDVLRFL